MLINKLISKIFFTILFLGIVFSAIAQSGKKDMLPVFGKGQSYMLLGYGVGNFWKSFLKQTISFPGVTYKVTAVGPVALVYEYGLHGRLSAGISASYSTITGKYSGYGDEFTDRLKIFTVLGRVNYHVLITTRWDLYAGGGLGYVHARYDNSDSQTSSRSTPGSLGYTLQGGGRYFFNRHWGIYAELGYVGGALAQAGLHINF